ncbi:MAG: nucleotide-diphospho-sugar transferase [Monoraphidium minutum]|nr:MAG: nucleotide-diphospho-sugar transferase [Monoraphidium minutum]
MPPAIHGPAAPRAARARPRQLVPALLLLAAAALLALPAAPRAAAAPPSPAAGPAGKLLAALEARGAAPGGGVPRILHQSWKTREVPARFRGFVASWRALNPGWRHVLWTDADNRRLAARRYPWFLGTFDALGRGVMRADAARYMYMHAFGGVYTDLDVECLRPLDDLFAALNASAPPPPSRRPGVPHGPAVVALMGRDAPFSHSLPNAWLASGPGHPLWIEALRAVAAAAAERRAGDWVEDITGPVVLKAAVEARRGAARLHRRCSFWDNPWFDAAACKRMAGVEARGAYAITYWAHSWQPRPANWLQAPPAARAAAALAGTAALAAAALALRAARARRRGG